MCDIYYFQIIVALSIIRLIYRSPRYGKYPDTTLSWNKELSLENKIYTKSEWSNKVFSLNKYLLDNTLPTGDKCRFNKPYLTEYFPLFMFDANDTVKTALTKVTDYCVTLRINQYFADGNHRTAILMMFELLSDLYNISCNADPVRLYIMISNRKQREWKSVKEKIVRELNQTSMKVEVVDDFERIYNAESCKVIWNYNSIYEDLSAKCIALRTDMTLRKKFREIKKKSRKRYNQWLWIMKESS